MKKSDPPITVEAEYATSIQTAWTAITSLEQMKQWFFEPLDSFMAEEGFTTQFLIELEDRKFTHLWKVLEVIENEKIKCQWKYQEYPGEAAISFLLKPLDGKVKLTLIAEVIEDFPDNIPEFKRESGVGGWNYFLKESLKNFLEG